MLVFDGPGRPAFKRDKIVRTWGKNGNEDQARKLATLFGFPVHQAPGEAEAECALLQKLGVVDCVLSEDVDTLMFGCGRLVRNWSGEGKANDATHVDLYELDKIEERLNITPEGMVLVALMSGGDYHSAGVRGCGVKLAVEAAKAGYGKSLAKIDLEDEGERRRWREGMVEEMHKNKSKFFKRRHPAVEPEWNFPNAELFNSYMHPIVSKLDSKAIQELREHLESPDKVQLVHLREYGRHYFGWKGRLGAQWFIKRLYKPLLIQKLQDPDLGKGELEAMLSELKIHGHRFHTSMGDVREVRVSLIPNKIVDIRLDGEQEVQEALDLFEEDEFGGSSTQRSAQSSAGSFDSSLPVREWIPSDILGLKFASLVEEFDKKLADKEAKDALRKAKKKGATQKGAMDKYVLTLGPRKSAHGGDAAQKEVEESAHECSSEDGEEAEQEVVAKVGTGRTGKQTTLGGRTTKSTAPRGKGGNVGDESEGSEHMPNPVSKLPARTAQTNPTQPPPATQRKATATKSRSGAPAHPANGRTLENFFGGSTKSGPSRVNEKSRGSSKELESAATDTVGAETATSKPAVSRSDGDGLAKARAPGESEGGMRAARGKNPMDSVFRMPPSATAAMARLSPERRQLPTSSLDIIDVCSSASTTATSTSPKHQRDRSSSLETTPPRKDKDLLASPKKKRKGQSTLKFSPVREERAVSKSCPSTGHRTKENKASATSFLDSDEEDGTEGQEPVNRKLDFSSALKTSTNSTSSKAGASTTTSSSNPKPSKPTKNTSKPRTSAKPPIANSFFTSISKHTSKPTTKSINAKLKPSLDQVLATPVGQRNVQNRKGNEGYWDEADSFEDGSGKPKKGVVKNVDVIDLTDL